MSGSERYATRKTVWAAFEALVVLISIASRTAFAQDVVQVSPETHVVVLENADVRVLAVQIKPGEKVGMHSHPRNVVYYLSDGKIKLALPEGRVEERTVKAGTAVWSDAIVHAAENVGPSEIREVQVELKLPAVKTGG